MRPPRSLLIFPAAAVTVALAAGPALADPPPGTTPRDTDIVGTSVPLTQNLCDQFSVDYNKTKPASKMYCFGSVNPYSLAIGDPIVPKAGCNPVVRPDGASASIAALDTNGHPSGDLANYCFDFAMVDRGRASTDPPYAPGGIAFVSLF